jgi:hypothetical protein
VVFFIEFAVIFIQYSEMTKKETIRTYQAPIKIHDIKGNKGTKDIFKVNELTLFSCIYMVTVYYPMS